MKRFIITEDERKHIMGLYEQVSNSQKDMYSTLIGYLENLSKSGMGIQGIDDMGAIKEYRVYLENLRDGKTPSPLSGPAQIVKKYVTDNIKNLSGEELSKLKDMGQNIQTSLYESVNMELTSIQSELEDSGMDVPVGELVDPTEPLCTLPQTGNPEEDSILSKVWEWAQSQSVETLQDMKGKIKEAISKAKEMVKGKRMNEQAAPLLIIGGVSITASMLIAVGVLLLFIIIICIVSSKNHNSPQCKRRRKLVKRFGMDGNFMKL